MYILFFTVILFILGSIWFYFYHIASEFISKFNITKKLRLIISLLFGLFVCANIILGLMFESVIMPFVLYLTVIALIFDGIYYLLNKVIKKDIYKIHIYLYIIPLLCALSFCIYGSYNIDNLKKTTYNLTAEELSQNLKIVFLSDTHYGKLFNKEKLNALVKELSQIKDIDMILLGGDMVDESTSKKEMEYLFSKLGSLQSTYGTYYVYGNHDRQTYSKTKLYSIKEIESVLEKNNITLLNDKAQVINDEIAIIGREDFSHPREDIKNLITKDISDKYLIVLDHQPQDYNNANKSGANLILSGHTHGGQLFPISIIIDLFKTSEMSYGHKKVNDLEAIVSSGVYGWGFPIRTEGKSEYVIINVKGIKKV